MGERVAWQDHQRFWTHGPLDAEPAIPEFHADATMSIASCVADGKSVLLIDDEPDLLCVMDVIMVISFPSAHLFKAQRAEQALEWARTTAFDCVVGDGANHGSHFVREFKALQPKTPIIYLSGCWETLKTARQFGATLTIPKPFVIEELITIITFLLQREAVNCVRNPSH